MEFTQEQILLQNTLRKFSQKELFDKAGDFDKKGEFPSEIINKLAEIGVLGAVIPEPFDGTALDMVSIVISLEELSQVCGSTSLIVATHNLFVAYPIVKFGSEELKKRYLPKLAFGELLGGFAEPELTNVKLKIDGDNIYLTGESRNIISGITQGLYLIFVNQKSPGPELTAVVIEGTTSGIKIKGRTETSGMRASGMCDVIFENVVVPKTNIVGKVGDGQMIYEAISERAKIGLGAIALGIAQVSVDAAIKYAKTRIQFSEPIINFGMVRSKIAEMATRAQAAKLLIYDAAFRCDQNKTFTNESAMAKYFTTKIAVQNTTDAIQLHGGYGYTKDFPTERYFRDCQICAILCGSSYQDREFIAKKTIG